jgi:hypothetical protein
MMNFYNRIKRAAFFHYFTVYVRYLLGGGFVYAALWKLPWNVDPTLFTETALTPAFAFRAIMRIKLLWYAVLLFQFVSGTLLLTQRFATIGAILYFPIILSITLLTISVGFRGTWLVTSLMTVANLYLLLWDFDKFRAIFYNRGNFTVYAHTRITHRYWAVNGFIIFGLSMLYLWHENAVRWMLSCLIWGLVSLIIFIYKYNKRIAKKKIPKLALQD